jgi:exodeoxyribonuclease VII large subunit
LKKFFLLLKPAAKEFLATTAANLRYLHMNITRSSGHLLIRESAKTDRKIIRLKTVTRQLLLKLHHQMEVQEKRNSYLDPYLILKRGYSVTYYQGRALKNPDTVPGDTWIETRLAEGNLKSKTI